MMQVGWLIYPYIYLMPHKMENLSDCGNFIVVINLLRQAYMLISYHVQIPYS